MRQIFDDGTWIDYAGDGSVVAYTDTTGRTYAPDTSIADSFLRSLGSSLSRAIDAKLNPQPVTTSAPAYVPATPFTARGLVVLLLVAGGAFALYKAAK